MSTAEAPAVDKDRSTRAGPGWSELTWSARLYVSAVITAGAVSGVLLLPRAFPEPVLFAAVAIFALLTSAWKVTLPLPIANGSTLSVSYAANLMALLLLGPRNATLIAAAGVCVQCTYKPKQRYPVHRTVFSTATAVLTMAATSAVFRWLGGATIDLDSFELAKPLVGAIGTYFVVNTALIAGAIALTTRRSFFDTWREDFLWLGASFMVAGTAGAIAAAIVYRGDLFRAVILIAPIYLTYRTYQLFAGRLEDEKRHTLEIQRLHQETMAALAQARDAERALAGEKERLAVALAEMTKLEDTRQELLVREQSARASAENANRLKDQFLAIVSHELRTPLNAILGWSEMLCKPVLRDDLRDRAVQGIHHGARRQAQLIDDLLDVARITSGKLRLERTFVDVREIVRDALEVVQPAADVNGVTLLVELGSSSVEVYGDVTRLQQVVLNLLSNAVKFTPQEGTVRVTVRRSADTVELVVSDTGKGIAPEFLPWVFEPFRQGDGSSTRMHAGLGLGLAIVKTLVEAHNGSVTARSAGAGQGATFTVRLPLAVITHARGVPVRRNTLPARQEAVPVTTSLDGLRVLIVDDDDQSRDVTAAHLYEVGACVLTAAASAEALELLQHERVDVLLADIAMPEEDGYALIRRVRALPPSRNGLVPAAALTAYAREEDRRRALDAGFQLHLSKPVDAGALVAAVANIARTSPT